MIRHTQSAQISQKQDGRNIYAIMTTMCPYGYHHKALVKTHALGHMIYINIYTFFINTSTKNRVHPSLFSRLMLAWKYILSKQS